MKFYFTTEYTLKIEGTTCVIDEATVKLQEIDLAIPKEFLTVMKALPKKIEVNVRIVPADLFTETLGQYTSGRRLEVRTSNQKVKK